MVRPRDSDVSVLSSARPTSHINSFPVEGDVTQQNVTVWIPPGLRGRTSRRTVVQVTGNTVRDVIDHLDQEFPGLRFNLCHETGELRPFVNIFLDREEVRYLQGLDTAIPVGAEIHIMHSVAGG